MDREGGFIVLHRRIRSWPLWYFLSAEQRMVWIQILLDANWRDSEAWIGAKRFTVKRGQLLHSESTIARHAGVSRKVVRTTLGKLIAESALVRERACGGANTPHVLTVVNYGKYQDVTEREGQQEGPREARDGPATGPRRALSEPDQPDQPVTTSPARKARKATDPRFGVLRQIWEAEFKAAKGADYRWSAADSVGLHRVIEVDPEDFRARAKRSLRIVGFLACGTVAKLTSGEVWNQLAGAAPGPKRVIENVSDWNEGQVQAWQSLAQRPSANGSESSASEGSEPTKTPSLKVAASPTTCPVLPLRT